MGKNVLIIGQGAREHAIAWKLRQSPGVDRILAAPGNAGIEQMAECYPISSTDTGKLMELVRQQGVDITIVGPEVPLMEGIVDQFEAEGLKIFGPRKNAALLEGSKVFSKNLLKKYGIPTAEFAAFTDIDAAREYVRRQGAPIVVKVDGLAAGKGVVVAQDEETAFQALETMLEDKIFGSAGLEVVLEECLEGEEVSVFALCDGESVVSLVPAQDHKRALDGDQGPNTGGMGAYTSPGFYTPELQQRVMEEILQPVVKAMAMEGRPYKGVLFAGLMLTSSGPKVLEFNCRFGDPETQVVLPMLRTDFLEVVERVIDGTLDGLKMEFFPGACVCVVMASGGYPGPYSVGKTITGLEDVADDIVVFHAGTKRSGDEIVTDGGRVLSVVCHGKDLETAINRVYQEIPRIEFAGNHYRKDIGARMLKY